MAEEHLNVLVKFENEVLRVKLKEANEKLEEAAVKILHQNHTIEKQQTVIRGLKSMLNQVLKGDDDR